MCCSVIIKIPLELFSGLPIREIIYVYAGFWDAERMIDWVSLWQGYNDRGSGAGEYLLFDG